MGGSYFHVGMAIGHFLADLVIHPSGDELGEGADERDLSGESKSGGYAYHVGFGDAALYEPVGKCRCEVSHLEGAFEVRRKGEYAVIRLAGFKKSCAKTAAGIFLSCINVFFHVYFLLINSLQGSLQAV